MDEEQTLDALASLLSELAQKPHDIALHAKHIQLSVECGQSQAQSAREMFTNYLAAGDEIWLPLIESKENSDDSLSPSGMQEILNLYARAEGDYLSIPILQKHLQFLMSHHEHFKNQVSKSDEMGDLFSTEWTRSAVSAVVHKGAGHLSQSHLLWDSMRDWVLEILEATPNNSRQPLVDALESLYLNRLQQPHSNIDETLQSYSTFTTNYKPPQEYESLLVTASKLRSRAVKSYQRREASELSLTQSNFSLDAYARYIATERRAKFPDLPVIKVLYERAIAEAAKRRYRGEPGAEDALRLFWVGYCDSLRIQGADVQVELETFRRAVKSVPGSGEIWARYIRYLERASESGSTLENRESVADIFSNALATGVLNAEVEQIIPLFLARAGFEKRSIEKGDAGEDALATLIGVLESGIEMVHRVSPAGDSRLRLEKFLAEIYLSLVDMPDNAIAVLQTSAKRCKSSYLAWLSYTDVLIKRNRYDEARETFQYLCMKNLDWPEAIWEAWITFEHLHGSVEDMDACLDKIEKAQYQVNARRLNEAEKASQQAMQLVSEQIVSNPVMEPDVEMAAADAAAAAPPDNSVTGGTKRKAEGTYLAEDNKKAKTEQNPIPLKRDRENSSVFVASLPIGVTEADLEKLFKDCGKIREVKITQLPSTMVATVEFTDRESVPAALTKDKKRLDGEEVAVHLAWKSTLYVTNFPENADDTFMRDLFGKYGVIFEIRWPSKKFKSTRRFCYVQYVSPSSATAALELHGRELEEGHPMNVFISNPERKRERTDANANDRGIYVAGLSKFTTREDLENLFKSYGIVNEVRIATGEDGKCKGFAFIDFEQEQDAQAALAANNHELKRRRIAVTLTDSRVRPRNRNTTSDTGLGRRADAQSRSVRVRNLPKATQEGILQQTMEKYASVKRVEVYANLNEATVELENAAEAGKLLLRTEPITFNGNTLQFTEESQSGSTLPGVHFVPRTAASRPKARLKNPKVARTTGAQLPAAGSSSLQVGKGQDDFRKLLNG